MFMFMWTLLLSLILTCILLGFGYMLSHKGMMNYDKVSPFECGFNPNVSYRSVFSLQFFLISLIFLVFDLELVLLFPFLSIEGLYLSLEGYVSCSLFIILLMLGLIYEWGMKSLEWCN